MIYFISDPHFNHENIIKYCNRPFADAEEMNAAIIKNWNRVVNPEDTVYCLGDFILGKLDSVGSILYQLNGHIVLVRGNHDTNSKLEYYAAHSDKVEVKDIAYIPYKGLYFVCCHFPMDNSEFLEMVIKDNSEIVTVHGHVHDKAPFTENMQSHVFNVSADVINFTPIGIESIWQIVRQDFIDKGVWRGE